jgi:WD40 repeat protein
MSGGEGAQLYVDADMAVVTSGAKIMFFFSNGSDTVVKPTTHTDTIRHVVLNKDRSLIASIGDDKIVSIWNKQGEQLHSTALHKKPTSAVFAQLVASGATAAEEVLLVGNKTGDVSAYPVPDVSKHARFMIGHTASIITALVISYT